MYIQETTTSLKSMSFTLNRVYLFYFVFSFFYFIFFFRRCTYLHKFNYRPDETIFSTFTIHISIQLKRALKFTVHILCMIIGIRLQFNDKLLFFLILLIYLFYFIFLFTFCIALYDLGLGLGLGLA